MKTFNLKIKKNIQIVFLGMFLLFLGILGSSIGFRINKSKSLPYKLFFSTSLRLSSIKKYSYISFHNHLFKYNLAKQVIGIEGDVLQIKDNRVFVSGVDRGLISQYSPMLKKKLFPLFLNGKEMKIPKEYFYVYAPADGSLDSRYSLIGLVHISQIKEKLWPLF